MSLRHQAPPDSTTVFHMSSMIIYSAEAHRSWNFRFDGQWSGVHLRVVNGVHEESRSVLETILTKIAINLPCTSAASDCTIAGIMVLVAIFSIG